MRLPELAGRLARGETTSVALVQDCLARIHDPHGEGDRTFMHVDAEGALRCAQAMDLLRASGAEPSPLAGIPFSVKDNVDVAGQPTRAGSRVLLDAAPVREDAPVVGRLRRAGMIPIGRTTMTEFAFSGIGLNKAFGTPRSTWRRAVGHVPGGSSSGGAVSVADGMAHAALATDTGGSSRVPAAFNGLVGFKPTAARIPVAGTVPLAPSLDGIGFIARSVACCWLLDTIATGTSCAGPTPQPLERCRFAVPASLLALAMDDEVRHAFQAAITRVAEAGATMEIIPFDVLSLAAEINADGGIAAIEAHAWHRDHIERAGPLYDPGVLRRILAGRGGAADGHPGKLARRKAFVHATARELEGFDALLFPTAGILPPRLADVERDPDSHDAAHAQALHNSRLVNLMDGCAVSLPILSPTGAPVGLTLAAPHGRDHPLLGCAAAVERTLESQPT